MSKCVNQSIKVCTAVDINIRERKLLRDISTVFPNHIYDYVPEW